VLVELAVVVPVLIVLVLMSFQLGMMLRQDMTVSAAARAGARVGSSAGVDREADYEVLQAVAAGLGTIPVADIELSTGSATRRRSPARTGSGSTSRFETTRWRRRSWATGRCPTPW
jgi:Flp pilus assembly protein TadG